MATITIYVSRNGNSTNLKLRDSEGHNPGNDDLTTDVNPGDTVQWELDNNSGLTSIASITKSDASNPKYQNSIDVLAAAPVNNNGIYSAQVVSPSPGKGKFENYNIGFTIPGSNEVYFDDPKMQLNA